VVPTKLAGAVQWLGNGQRETLCLAELLKQPQRPVRQKAFGGLQVEERRVPGTLEKRIVIRFKNGD
jgi:hypothetical protein